MLTHCVKTLGFNPRVQTNRLFFKFLMARQSNKEKNKMAPRCYICDYSETGEVDPFRISYPQLDISNKVVYDNTTRGYAICLECLAATQEALDEFPEEEEVTP